MFLVLASEPMVLEDGTETSQEVEPEFPRSAFLTLDPSGRVAGDERSTVENRDSLIAPFPPESSYHPPWSCSEQSNKRIQAISEGEIYTHPEYARAGPEVNDLL